MRKASRDSRDEASSSRPRAGSKRQDDADADADADASSGSNYQSLESIVSSESRDDSEALSRESLLSREMNLLDKEETYHCSTTSSESGEGSNQSKNPIARLRSRPLASSRGVAPPPPPASPPPMYRARNRQSGSSSQYEGLTYSDSTNSAATQQKKALVSLLTEMRSLERQMQQLQHDHAVERHAMVQNLEAQAAHIQQLEASNQSLQRQNAIYKRQLTSVLTKLDRFATGCWRFSSASVKKMSEALHMQVHEWGRMYSIDTSNGMASPEEDAAMEETTMEKLQTMHLEIRQLREKNVELAKRGGKSVKRRAARSRSDESDDKSVVSDMSGVTQLTATTTLTSTTKMMDAMSGFLTEHEGQTTPGARAKPHKKAAPMASPRGILKPTSRYDRRTNGRKTGTQQKPEQGTTEGAGKLDGHLARSGAHPGLPKSPHDGRQGQRRARVAVVNSAVAEADEFADFDSVDWGGGDEESEV